MTIINININFKSTKDGVFGKEFCVDPFKTSKGAELIGKSIVTFN